jgi:hypothetical protein
MLLAEMRDAAPCSLRRLRTGFSKLGVTLGFALSLSTNAMPQNLSASDTAVAQLLMSRVGPSSEVAIVEAKKAGMQDIRPHTLTASERSEVEAALSALPALNRRVLVRKLHHLAFLDGIPGQGSGLTSEDAKTGLYDITLRASLLGESLSEFLTTKERRVFVADGSGITVTVSGAGVDALTYVLLHESAHVVDRICGTTSGTHGRFNQGVWSSLHGMTDVFASSVAGNTYFRGSKPIEFARATTVFDSLALTPFVSLYSTASAEEDFAELLAWREIMTQHHGTLTIAMKEGRGARLKSWDPLTFPKVQQRFIEVDKLLASQGYCEDRL